MKNCTNHSLIRWTERIVGIKSIKERDDHIRENNQQLKEHMNKTLDFATYIWKGQIGDNITRNYYIHNDIIFVLNTQNDAIITVYKIDFNFTPEINLQVSKGLVKEIHSLVERKEQSDYEVLEEMEKMKHESLLLSQEEDVLREQLNVLKEKKKSLDESIKNIDCKSKLIELEIKKHTNNLVNSREYKEDLKTM